MQTNIHPKCNSITVRCSCGNYFVTRSTYNNKELKIEICSNCHPFYTGTQKIVDTAGRVDRFKQKYGTHSSSTLTSQQSSSKEKES